MDHGVDRPAPHHYEQDREHYYHRGQIEGAYDERRGLDRGYHGRSDYNLDVEKYGGQRLKGDIEHEYD